MLDGDALREGVDREEGAAGAGGNGAFPLGVLGLAPLAIFIWQYVITYTLLNNPFGSMSAYYYGRCLLALPVALLFFKAPSLRERDGGAFSLLMALVAGVAPIALTLAPGSPAFAWAACLGAGTASTWFYLRVFLMFSYMSVHDALTLLLGTLSLSYVCRMALGAVSQGLLLVLGAAMPFMCVLVAGWGIGRLIRPGAGAVVPGVRNGASTLSAGAGGLYRVIVAEFAVYGLVAGFVRTPYEAAQFETTVNVGGGLLLFMGNVALLWWARREYADMHLRGVCQAILFLFLTVLLALALFGNADSAVAAIASLFARFGVYTLLLCVLCILIPRLDWHPYTSFGIGWGFFTLATGVGMSAAALVGVLRFSATVALVIAYALFVATFAAYTRVKGNDRLFAPSDADESADVSQAPVSLGDGCAARSATDAMTLDDIARRCGEIGEAHGLTRREVEVVRLICLGRSKGYIAESLSVTENTVRGYAKNAYRKLGIHSRQDLLTLVGVE